MGTPATSLLLSSLVMVSLVQTSPRSFLFSSLPPLPPGLLPCLAGVSAVLYFMWSTRTLSAGVLLVFAPLDN